LVDTRRRVEQTNGLNVQPRTYWASAGRILRGIELRERQLAAQIGELAARRREAQAEREALATTARTVRAVAPGLDLERPPNPMPPDGAAHQQIMDVSEHERRPLRARDPCLALDLPLMPKHVEGTRETQTPGRPRIPRRDRTRTVRTARPSGPDSSREDSPVAR
jgi:hypothetical protein